MHFNFDPSTAYGPVKDGNLKVRFENSGVAIVQGYEVWAAQGRASSSAPKGELIDLARVLGEAETRHDIARMADVEPQDINLVTVFDRFGSMCDDPGAPG